MSKRDEQRRQADRNFEESRQAVAAQSDEWLCEALREIPHRKWMEIAKDERLAIGILAHRAAQRIAELTARVPAACEHEWAVSNFAPPCCLWCGVTKPTLETSCDHVWKGATLDRGVCIHCGAVAERTVHETKSAPCQHEWAISNFAQPACLWCGVTK